MLGNILLLVLLMEGTSGPMTSFLLSLPSRLLRPLWAKINSLHPLPATFSHTGVDLANETKLDKELKSWLAFAAQKIVEIDTLASAPDGKKDEVRKAADHLR
ncbi:hypothetical protein MLD38_030847 [Melastoma candidum]|uniref:Uncharacterized protein n=1 Tax=Melastoma candidum TaxID=119954 RepID=A0ACB9MMX6_9MYRT|nr:hypothetical protein MLD38_030847 [Melastoma candidum]